MEEKKAIRKQIFAERKACSDKEIQEWSKEITKNITALPEYQTADRILVYHRTLDPNPVTKPVEYEGNRNQGNFYKG